MVNTAALQSGRSFTSENAPVRIFFVVFIIQMFHIIVTDQINFSSTFLSSLTAHDIRTHANNGIAVVVKFFDSIP